MAFRMTEEEYQEYIERKRREAAPSKVRDFGDACENLSAAVTNALASAGGVRETSERAHYRAARMEPSEEQEQITLFEWAETMTYTYPDLRWLYHVPNGGSRGTAEAGRFKAMGVKSGVPDVALDIPRGGFHGLRVEMKRTKGGKLSDAQREWIDHYNAIGYRAVVCHGWQEAAKAIEEYLKREATP